MPCNEDDVRDIMDAAFPYVEGAPDVGDDIDESIFIPMDMDCGFQRHMRYMPAFRHTHKFFEMLVVLEGECISWFEDGPLTFHTGDICIQAPGTGHCLSAFSDDAVVMNILIRQSTFEHSFIGLLDLDTITSGFFRRAFMDAEAIPYIVFHTGEDAQVIRDIDRAYEEFESSRRYRRQMVNALLTELFLHLLQEHEKDLEIANVRLRDQNDSVMYILRYMQENYTTITLHSLAAFFNYSDRQMQRIIREATGATFIENIRVQKMHRAKELLTRTNLSINLVAEKCGYDSVNNFRRTFMACFHESPHEYRKKHTRDQVRRSPADPPCRRR